MKTVTLGWLRRYGNGNENLIPSLEYSTQKYQYYFCPTNAERPFAEGGFTVKIKRAYAESVLEHERAMNQETWKF
jgi:hypothetical protein